MAKSTSRARCQDCGHIEPRWVGRCPACGAWGTVHEEQVVAARAPRAASRPARATPITEVGLRPDRRTSTGSAEVDRVLGGGLVPGSVTLLGGEPGAGKSTLLLQLCRALARRGRRVLYVSAEESCAQVRLRAERLDALAESLLLASESELAGLLELAAQTEPDLLVVDSIQTVRDAEASGSAGSVGQVRECTAALVRHAKDAGVATVLVGHVTKDGGLAGPRVLEHLVDTVVELTGDRHHDLRLLVATKHRFGAVGEVGCLEMTGRGLVDLTDPGRVFTGDVPPGTSGVATTMLLEGTRPLACEVQALVAHSTLAYPRRVGSGLDSARLALLIAVLEQRAGLRLQDRDVYATSVGGVRVTDPGADLALCLALASSRTELPVPRDLVAVGEVGLAGEVRIVAGTERRLAEAARLGFGRALVPKSYTGVDGALAVVRVHDVGSAIEAGTAVR